jgi:hypothetical protein
MTKARRYDTVVLAEPIGVFGAGEKGAVVEVYATPYEAYDIEIVTDEGKTTGLLEAVRPEQIEVASAAPPGVRIASIHLRDDAAAAAVSFSDGTEVTVTAEELYARVA